MSRISHWFKHSFWNTAEQGLTRIADAVLSLLLLWTLAPEAFSRLAVAQAVAAPLLIFFVSPGWAVYREFAQWKSEGAPILAARVHALRVYGWGLGQFAVVLALAVAWFVPISGVSYLDAVWTLLWALALVAGGHLAAADKELLRLELKLKTLNLITVLQKGTILGGSALVAWRYEGRVDLLAGVAVASMVVSAWVARTFAIRQLELLGAPLAAIRGRSGPSTLDTLTRVTKEFSIWNHLSGVVLNWVQTLDVFFLGAFRVPAVQVGLYSAALKVANLASALPTAVGSIFLVWLGRRSPGGVLREKRELGKFTALLFLGVLVESGVLIFFSPWISSLLSHGRWTLEEQASVSRWMRWILAGSVFFCSTFLVNYWIILRAKMAEVFFRVYLPWLTVSAAIYAVTAGVWGPDAVAPANLPVALVYLFLLALQLRRTVRGSSE